MKKSPNEGLCNPKEMVDGGRFSRFHVQEIIRLFIFENFFPLRKKKIPRLCWDNWFWVLSFHVQISIIYMCNLPSLALLYPS